MFGEHKKSVHHNEDMFQFANTSKDGRFNKIFTYQFLILFYKGGSGELSQLIEEERRKGNY